MTRSPVYLTDLACSERLTLWTIRRLAGIQTNPHTPTTGPSGGLFLPCFRQEFLAVAQTFHDALTDMAALEMPALDIRVGCALSVTSTEYRLLLATEAAQNERNTDMDTLLQPLVPFAGLRARLASAITTLGACLASAGYWLSSVMGWTAPNGIAMCQGEVVAEFPEEATHGTNYPYWHGHVKKCFPIARC
ncbi:hypothetical protein, partial [Acetobacter pasteurianus]|uniref:hypothetical protein n=1 Tax=Acetobacter pasteurianus TaxID=438 RepID=UPI00216B5068